MSAGLQATEQHGQNRVCIMGKELHYSFVITKKKIK